MVRGGGVGRVAAVIRRNHNQVLRAHLFHKLRQPAVKLRQGRGVAVDVPAVAVKHIEIHQIDKAQAGEVLVGVAHGLVHAVGVALGVDVLRGALARKDVIDLTDRDGVQPRVLEGVQHGFLGRFQGEIVAVCRAGIVPVASDEGTGDDPAHAVLPSQDPPGDPAVLVELFHGNHVLVSRDLEDGIRGGIDDQIPGLHVLVTVLVDDGGSGPGSVCQDAPPGGLPEGLQNFLGEAVGIGGQRLGRNNACDLPVSDGGILTHGGLRDFAEGSGRLLYGTQEFQPVDVAQARLTHIRNIKFIRGRAGTQRIHAEITELGGVRKFSRTTGIKHEKKYTFHCITYLSLIKVFSNR